MADAPGYSGKSLTDKLGLKRDTNLALIHVPDDYDDLIGGWPLGSSISWDLAEPSYEFIHYFVAKRILLEAEIEGLIGHMERESVLWVSWPKQASGMVTDVTEQTLRDVILPMGLVDVKVVAVDDTWSGLKFVWRKELR